MNNIHINSKLHFLIELGGGIGWNLSTFGVDRDLFSLNHKWILYDNCRYCKNNIFKNQLVFHYDLHFNTWTQRRFSGGGVVINPHFYQPFRKLSFLICGWSPWVNPWLNGFTGCPTKHDSWETSWMSSLIFINSLRHLFENLILKGKFLN